MQEDVGGKNNNINQTARVQFTDNVVIILGCIIKMQFSQQR